MGRSINEFTDIINTIEVAENSVLKEIKFIDSCGDTIKYSIKTLYQFKGMYGNLAIINNRSLNKEYLIDMESLQKMIEMGYIDNAMMTSGNYIKYHSKLAKFSGAHKFEVDNIQSQTAAKSEVNRLINRFGYLIKVDHELEYRAIHRLDKVGVAFSLGKSVTAVELENKFEHMIVSLAKFEKMTDAEGSKDNFSPRSEAQNFTRALPYAEITKEEYDRLSYILNSYDLGHFTVHECGKYYRTSMRYVTLEMAKEIYGIDKVYFAIPNPEKFIMKSHFESAIRCPNHLDFTEYSENNYTLVKCIGLDREKIIDLLLSNYEYFKSKEYKEKYKNIIEWINYMTEMETAEANKKYNELRDIILDKLKSGASQDDILDYVNKENTLLCIRDIQVSNAYELLKYESTFLNNSPTRAIKQQGHKLSFEELCDFFDISYTNTPEDTNTPSILELKTVDLNDHDNSCIKLIRDTCGIVRIKLMERKSGFDLTSDILNVSYKEWLENKIDYDEIVRSLIRKFLMGRNTSYSVDDIIQELKV